MNRIKRIDKYVSYPLLLVMLVLGLFVSSAISGQVNGLTTFTNGTTADATQVNANFNIIRTAVNDNDTRITALEGAGAPGGGIIVAGGPFVSGNADLYICSVDGGGTSEDRQTIAAPRNGTIANLFIRPNQAPSAGAMVTAAIRINGVDTAVTVTHDTSVNGANAVGDTANTVAISQGDNLVVHLTESTGNSSGANWIVSFEYR